MTCSHGTCNTLDMVFAEGKGDCIRGRIVVLNNTCLRAGSHRDVRDSLFVYLLVELCCGVTGLSTAVTTETEDVRDVAVCCESSGHDCSETCSVQRYAWEDGSTAAAAAPRAEESDRGCSCWWLEE